MKKVIKVWTLAILAISLLFTVGCSKSEETIRIVHKNYTEQRLMGQVLSVYLESKGFDTEVSELGGTMLCFNALKNGDADMYPEYTGSVYSAVLDQTQILDPDETYNYVKSKCEDKYGITWMEPFGFNNTYVVSVTKEMRDEYDLKTISDLTPISGDMVIGSDSEFASRIDGYIGMLDAYPGLEFKELKSMDQGLTYQALVNGDLDVNVSFTTDGRIAKFGLVNLEDDKGFFPPYYCTPILRQDLAEENPEVVEALKELKDRWSDEEMQEYNLMVDEGGEPRDVATQMLTDEGLIKQSEES